jgi:hypothetical protein
VASSLAIGRVRIRRAPRGGDDGLRLRLGVDRLLAGLDDAAPRRLPPAAILVVRSMTDPLPGRLDVRAGTLAPRWRGAVAAALDDHAARAARPALGDPGADAAAVVFADRAELLACLAGDVAAGAVGARWWWQALRIRTPAAVLRAFADTPEALPAALVLLAGGRPPRSPAGPGPGAVAAFAARLPPAGARELALVVARTFGAAPVAAAGLAATPGAGSGSAPSESARAPWDELLGAPARALAVEQQVLAGLGVALARSRAVVRSAAFERAVTVWSGAAAHSAGTAAAGRADDDDSGGASHAAGARPPTTGPPHPGTHPATARDRVTAPHEEPAPVPAAPPLRRAAHAAPHGAPRAARRSAAPVRPPGGRTADHPPAPAPHPSTAAPGSPGPEPLAAVICTDYGGLFQLVHLAQRLGVYGDFTAPSHPGLRLDPWDFVTLVGRRLLGRPPLGADAVWPMLAALAGRSRGVAPGAGLRPPLAWRVPRGWLAPFRGDRGAWRSARDEAGRLRLVHPAGFTVVDAPAADLGRELARYAVPDGRVRDGGPTRAPAAPGERWVAHMAGYVRARLTRALGLSPAGAVRAALVRPAFVAVTATQVDVTSQLADLPIEVRVAGLDRDPGFVPAAGRTLRLHFT